MTLPTLSLTEAQALTALRAFLAGVVPSGTEIIRAEQNRVPEPAGPDFIVMTPLLQERLETNETVFDDNIVVGSIAGTVLTVTQVTRGFLAVGQLVTDGAWPNTILANTVIVAQLSGPPGGIGTYTVSQGQTLASEILYAGVRADTVATKLTVQLDVHGPASGNNATVIQSLFRSGYATDAFALAGFDVVPLYCSDARQAPFINAEQQFEYRWSMDAVMQINPVIGTPQQFAAELDISTVEAGVNFASNLPGELDFSNPNNSGFNPATVGP